MIDGHHELKWCEARLIFDSFELVFMVDGHFDDLWVEVDVVLVEVIYLFVFAKYDEG